MSELTSLIEAVRKYRTLCNAHVARWDADNAWMRRTRPVARDWHEYDLSTGALVDAHREIFQAALALGDVAPVGSNGDYDTSCRGSAGPS